MSFLRNNPRNLKKKTFTNAQRKQFSELGTLTGASAKSQIAKRSTANAFKWGSSANQTNACVVTARTPRKT